MRALTGPAAMLPRHVARKLRHRRMRVPAGVRSPRRLVRRRSHARALARYFGASAR